MANYKGVGFDDSNGRIRTGASTDKIEFDTSVQIAGNLDVTGTIVTRDEQRLLIQDNFVDLNVGYTSNTGLAGGIAVNYKATTTGVTVVADAGGVEILDNNSISTGSAAVAPTATVVVTNNGNLTNSDRIEVVPQGGGGPVVFDFGSGAGEIAIGGNDIGTAGNIASVINANANFSAVNGGTNTVTITYPASGTTGNGNAVTVVSSGLSKTDFAGGAAPTTGDTITLSTSGGGSVVFTAVASGGSGLNFDKGGSASATATNLATAINDDAAFTAVVSSASNTVVQITSGSTAVATSDASAFGVDDNLSLTFTAATGANRPKITAAAASMIPADTFAENDLLQVAGTDNAANDGFYVVHTNAVAGTIEVKSTEITGTADTLNTKFSQVNFTADTDTSGTITLFKVNVSALQANSTSGSFEVAAGDQDTDFSSFSPLGGTNTLQEAYDAAPTIVTDSTGAIAFTFDTNALGFTMDGDAAGVGNVTMGATNTINTFTVDAAGAISYDAAGASNFTVAEANLTLSTTTSGDIDITSAATLDIDAVAVELTSTGGLTAALSGAASSITSTSQNLTLATATSGDIDITSAATLDIDAVAVELTSTGGLTGALSGAASSITSTAQNLTLETATSGTLAVTSAGTLDLDGVAVNIDSSGAMDITAADGQTLSVNHGGGSALAIAADGEISLTGESAATVSIGSTAADLSLSTTTSGEIDITSAGAVDINVGAAFTMDAASASTLTVAGANLSLATTTSGAIDLLAAGVFSIDGTGTSNVTATSGNLTLSTATSGDVDISAVGEVDIDGATASITTSGAYTITGAAASSILTTSGDLTIGGGTQANAINITSAEAQADAIKITASDTAGGIDIDGGTSGIDINTTGVLTQTSDDTITITMDADSASNKEIVITANNAGGGEGNIKLDADDQFIVDIASTTSCLVTTATATTLTGDLLPAADDTHNLGSSSAAWANAFVETTLTFTGAISGESSIVLPTNQGDALSITDGSADILTIVTTTGQLGVIFAGMAIFDTTLGFAFGLSGDTVNDFIDDNTFTTGVDGNSIASSESIKAYVDSRGITNFTALTSMTSRDAISAGNVIAIKTTGGNEGGAIRADADAIATCNVIGIAVEAATSGNPVRIAQAGTMGGFSGLTAGAKQFASTTAGGLTEDISTFTSGDVVFQVGFAISTTEIVIQPMFVMEIG